MKLLEGVLLYELVLMILGFVLGLALIYAFVLSVMQGKTNLKLLIYFFIPIVMIGYPSIKSVSFNNGVVELQKTTRQVELNPRDTVAIAKLVSQMEDLSTARATQSSDALSAVAQAQVALGQYDDAKQTVSKAAAIDPKSTTVIQTQKSVDQKIEVKKELKKQVEALDKLNKKIEVKPNNRPVRDSIAAILQKVNQFNIHADQADLLTVAWSNALIGKSDLALQAAQVIQDNSRVVLPEVDEFKHKVEERKIDHPTTPPSPAREIRRLPNNTPEKEHRVDSEKANRPPVAAPAPVSVDTALFKIRLMIKKEGSRGKWERNSEEMEKEKG